MAFLIARGGPDCTFQDEGRFGFRDKGVPPGGVFDRCSARAADDWVQNSGRLSAMIEVGPFGLTLEATSTHCVGLAGASRNVMVGGREFQGAGRAMVQAGEQVAFHAVQAGCRSYLSVPGGFEVKEILGSVSGAIMEKGGLIKVRGAVQLPVVEGEALKPNVSPIRIFAGPEAHAGLDRLLAQDWQISPATNRQGIRLMGAAIPHEERSQSSTPQCMGVIQLPSGGEPIILGPDGPTLGGYPKIAVVVDVDLDRLAQFVPGDWIRFEVIVAPPLR